MLYKKFKEHNIWKMAIFKYLLLSTFFYLLLIPGLGTSLIQTNEPDWVERSERFYRALDERDFSSTYQKYHPGVTLMWLVGACEKIFWKYQKLTQGYTTPLFEYGTYQQFAFFTKLLQGTIFLCLLLFGINTLQKTTRNKVFPVALGLLLVLEPLVHAMLKTLSPDPFLLIFTFCSLVFFHSYNVSNKKSYLILTSLFTALALLTKITSFVLLTVFLIFLVSEAIRTKKYKSVAIKIVGITVLSVIFFFLFFPAMWTKPLETMGMIIRDGFLDTPLNDFASPIINPVIFSGKLTLSVLSYPIVLFFRSTPFIFILSILGFFLIYKKHPNNNQIKSFVILLSIFAFIYYIPITYSQKKIYKYITPFFIYLSALSAYYFNYVPILKRKILAIIFLVSLLYTFFYIPNFLLYFNPILGGARIANKFIWFNTEATGYKEIGDYINQKKLPEETLISAHLPLSLGSYVTVRVNDIRYYNKQNTDYMLIPLYAKTNPEFKSVKIDDCLTLEKKLSTGGVDYLFLYRNVCKK